MNLLQGAWTLVLAGSGTLSILAILLKGIPTGVLVMGINMIVARVMFSFLQSYHQIVYEEDS